MSTPQPAAHRSKTQLAQLVGEALIHAAPHTAKINTDESTRQINDWLDGLEAHTATFVRPFLEQILEHSDPPEHVKALLAEAIDPTAAFSATIEQIALFSILSSVISVAITPFLQGTANTLTAAAVATGSARPVNPGILATAAGRGFTFPQPPTVAVPQAMVAEAAKSGITQHDLELQASLVGLPPSLQELFEMVRRGIISTAGGGAPGVQTNQVPATDRQGNPLTVERGLQEGDFRTDWIGAAVQLAHAYLTPLDFVRAAVQEQMSYTDARDWAHATGLDWNATVPLTPGAAGQEQDMFGVAYSIAGRPPGPQELAHMTHRGILPATGPNGEALTFKQGIAESDVKTKWSDVLLALSDYLPPPEMVNTLLEHGGLTIDQAHKFWTKAAVQPDLAKALEYVAGQQAIQQDKLETKRDIQTAYFDGIIDHPTAMTYLGLLGYHSPVADQVLAIQDFKRELTAINKVVSKIGTLYTEFKITPVNALKALAGVGLPLPQQQALIGIWELLRVAPIRLPSVAEIGSAVKYKTITEADGLAELAILGYQPRDAAIVLSAHAQAPITPLPPAGTAVV